MRPLAAGSYRTVPGLHYKTPKELWGFHSARVAGAPDEGAKEFLRANEALLGLQGIRGQLGEGFVVESLGARHVIFQQRYEGARIHRAYVTVHLGRSDRRIYLVKNRAVPRRVLPDPVEPRRTVEQATRKAIQSIKLARGKVLSTERLQDELMWYPIDGGLRLAWKLRVHAVRQSKKRRNAESHEEWIIYTDALNGSILSEYDNLAAARAWVFDPNPVITLGGDERLLRNGQPVPRVPDDAYWEVELENLDDTGFLDGHNVTTAPMTAAGFARAPAVDGDFLFTSRQRGFEEAMVYFHIDRAIQYLQELGFRGDSAIFTKPLGVNARATRADSSWYSPGRKELFFGLGGGVNDAEDAETILHELGHAIQDAICPDFGQSTQAAAMGEGFGDYLALSFFEDRPVRYRDCVMTWDGITWDDHDPPCLRKLDRGLTMESYDDNGDEHDNGEVWAETLLSIKAALGREVGDTIIVESHFQQDGFTNFARGARAILDADRNLYEDRHARALRKVFERRGIGPI